MSKNSEFRERVVLALNPDKVIVRHSDNFTVAVIVCGKDIGIGAAKRKPDDKPDEAIGDGVAYWRAVRDMVESFPDNPAVKKVLKRAAAHE